MLAAVGASAHFIGDRESPKLSPIQLPRHDSQGLSEVGFAGCTSRVTDDGEEMTEKK